MLYTLHKYNSEYIDTEKLQQTMKRETIDAIPMGNQCIKGLIRDSILFFLLFILCDKTV